MYSVTQKEELDDFVASPQVTIYDYGPTSNETNSLYMSYYAKLGEIKCQVRISDRFNDVYHYK